MAPTRGKCIFNDDLAKKFPIIVKVKDKTSSDVKCTMCNSEFNIANGGKSEIERHLTSVKHVRAQQAKSFAQPMTSFLARVDYTAAAQEGTWAYHVIKANNSFLSTDCTTTLFRECFGLKNFHSARTKTEAIVTNVLAPLGENMIKEELLNSHFITLTTDASNRGNVKLMPVIARYFMPTVGVRVKMLDFCSIKNETSETIANLLMKTAEQNGIVDKFVGFCADNCPTNFGSAERGGENNVFYKLKQWKPSMIGVGCAAHVAHNAVKYSSSRLPMKIENVVVKIYKHFHINTVRVEALKSLCEAFEEIEYIQLLGYAQTRFLALGPAISRILTLFVPLKEYFSKLTNCSKTIRTFFDSPLSKLLLLFVRDQVFCKYLLFFLMNKIKSKLH